VSTPFEPLVEPAQEVLVEALIVEDDDGGVAVADRPAIDEQLLGAPYLFVAVEVPAQVQAGLVPVRDRVDRDVDVGEAINRGAF
jgi:hypothetical protein